MDIVKSKSGKKAIGIAMAATIVASIFAMIAPASVADVPTPMPDLIVTDINSYHNNTGCPAWFNVSNEIDVTVKNNGNATASASKVCLYIDGKFFGKLSVPSLGADNSSTVTFTGWKPIGDDCLQQPCAFNWSYRDYNFTAIADCDNEVDESDETNNATTVIDRACYNGYMADEPLGNVAHGKLHGHMIYTTGDGAYKGLYSVGDTQVTNYNINLPAGATTELAYLNVYYTWCKPASGVDYACPEMEVNITTPGGTYTLPLERAYNDTKCTCPGAMWNYPFGNYVYNVTDYITANGTYTVTVKNVCTQCVYFCVAAPGLFILYEDPNAPLIEYWLNEGADLVMGGRRYSTSSNLAWWECINNATFPASTETMKVENATLGVVSPWGGSSWTPGSTNYLFFNGVKLGQGVYHGHSSLYNKTIDSISMYVGASGNTQVGANVTDVTALYLKGSDNVVGQADGGDNMMPAGAFLVVQYGAEAKPDLNVTAKTENWIDLDNRTYKVRYTVKNIGGAVANESNTTITIDGVDVFEDRVPALAAGASYTNTVGPFTMTGASDTVKVCTDNDNEVDESNEDNNCMENVLKLLPNVVYFTPLISKVPEGKCHNTTVQVWVNATDAIDLFTTDISFDPTCINITDVEFGPAWTVFPSWSHHGSYISIGAGKDACTSGEILLANLTVHCEDCCKSMLSFTGEENVSKFIGCTPNYVAASWINGSVQCGVPVDVNKTVLNPDTGEWVDSITAERNETVTFRSLVHPNCCNLTMVTVTDAMSEKLEYVNGSALVNGVPQEPVVIGNSLVWNFPALNKCNTLNITFDAKATDYGTACNTQIVKAYCAKAGEWVSGEDNAYVTVGIPVIAVEFAGSGSNEATVQPQSQFDVNITVDSRGAGEVYAVEYYLTYNTSVLRAETQVKKEYLGSTGDTIVVINDIDQTNGVVSYAETRKVDGGVTGKGTVATIQFTVIGERGAMSNLNLSDVIIVNSETNEPFDPIEVINGTVKINENRAPIAIGTSKHRINNVAKKYQSTAILCSCSYDPDYPGKGGNITYIRWAFGDGQYGTTEGLPVDNCTCKEHKYESWLWENGHYLPFNVTLTVTDDGCPELSNSTHFDVTIYIAGDANGDGKVNILDAVRVGKHWRDVCGATDPCANCTAYLWDDSQADGADLNNDCKINILDAVIIGANWRHVAW